MAARTQAGRRRLTAEQRRERILRGAMKVFAERGYEGASMGEVARAAGISPAVIYDHFASKAELQITLLERETAQMVAFIASALEAAGDDPAERLRAGVDAFFAFVEEHPFAWRMIFRDPPLDPAVATAYRDLGNRTTGAVEVFIKSGAPAAMLAGPDADERIETFAKLITAAQTGIAYWWYEHRDVPREVLVNRFLDFCWLGLERVSAGERVEEAPPKGLGPE